MLNSLNFTDKIPFNICQKTSFPEDNQTGVYVIFGQCKIYNTYEIIKIGEGRIRRRFRKYLWASKYGMTAHRIRELNKRHHLLVSWILCPKDLALRIEQELLTLYYNERKGLPIGNKIFK